MSQEQSQQYKGNGAHVWECVLPMSIDRLRVPGGWIYRDHRFQNSVFVPMPEVVKHKV